VVGVLRTGDGPSIGLRADMDALPIHEANDIPYRSKHEGIIHVCGHDGHTTYAAQCEGRCSFSCGHQAMSAKRDVMRVGIRHRSACVRLLRDLHRRFLVSLLARLAAWQARCRHQ
jgi:hypothetical protein